MLMLIYTRRPHTRGWGVGDKIVPLPGAAATPAGEGGEGGSAGAQAPGAQGGKGWFCVGTDRWRGGVVVGPWRGGVEAWGAGAVTVKGAQNWGWGGKSKSAGVFFSTQKDRCWRNTKRQKGSTKNNSRERRVQRKVGRAERYAQRRGEQGSKGRSRDAEGGRAAAAVPARARTPRGREGPKGRQPIFLVWLV